MHVIVCNKVNQKISLFQPPFQYEGGEHSRSHKLVFNGCVNRGNVILLPMKSFFEFRKSDKIEGILKRFVACFSFMTEILLSQRV